MLENLILDAGLAGRIQRDRRDADDEGNGETYKRRSTWVAIARTSEDLAPIAGDARWKPVAPHAGAGLWTDDFSNIFGALKW